MLIQGHREAEAVRGPDKGMMGSRRNDLAAQVLDLEVFEGYSVAPRPPRRTYV
jgi:hypothetical protein